MASRGRVRFRYPLRVILETPRLILRPITLDDVAAVHVFEGDPEVARFGSTIARSLAQVDEYVRAGIASAAEEPRTVWEFGVVERDSGVLVGRVGFKRQAEPREASIWYALRRDRWGRGYAREAMVPLVDFAFLNLGLHRVWADVDPENAPSMRVAQKLGMRQEAHHLENVCIHGEWRGTAIFAILAREWRGRASS